MARKLTDQDWERIKQGFINRSDEVEVLIGLGLYFGGDQMVEKLLPPNTVLNAKLERILELGIQSLSGDIINILDEHQVANQIWDAAVTGRECSVIRLGDGELLTLAQDSVYSINEINELGKFLPIAGVKVPDLHARDMLLASIKNADIVGIPVARRSMFQNLFWTLAKYYDLPIKKKKLTTSVINYTLKNTDVYHKLFKNLKVLLIGNRMTEFRQHLANKGYNSIVGTIPVAGTTAIPVVLDQVESYDFDVAIVSAGVAATIMCPLISERNKIAIDFGHMADEMLSGNRSFQ